MHVWTTAIEMPVVAIMAVNTWASTVVSALIGAARTEASTRAVDSTTTEPTAWPEASRPSTMILRVLAGHVGLGDGVQRALRRQLVRANADHAGKLRVDPTSHGGSFLDPFFADASLALDVTIVDRTDTDTTGHEERQCKTGEPSTARHVDV